ncbi:hypothetical protein VTN00DRAFT_9909 [Thermoascus crustaceus]|uniref:uncharacterized protein n=1 Tax=Thermoascus crustaceus TaxID=5088 RepID=UPI0037427A07
MKGRCKSARSSVQHAIRKFPPVLPPGNYIEKLVELQECSDAKVEPYEAIGLQPAGVRAELRAHQLEGFSFLVTLMRNDVGGILGDDMGLGKTLQVVSFFQYLKANQHATVAPFLVVCPLSVLQSWVDEAKRWTPGFKILKYHDLEAQRKLVRAALAKSLPGHGHQDSSSADDEPAVVDVLVITYDMITADKD